MALGIILGITPAPVSNPQFGATIATTSIADTLGTLRTNVNSSLENINTQLESVSSTIGTYGSIAVENSPLSKTKGGTGLTTAPADGQILSANGTDPAWHTLVGVGVSISTTTTSTIITSSGVDTSADITWTGTSTFAGKLVATGNATFATSTFSQIPTTTSTLPTASTQLTTKGYVDLFSDTIATSTSFNVTASGNTVTSSTVAFSLSATSSVIYLLDGKSSGSCGSTGNCSVSIEVDGSNSTSKSLAEATVSYPMMMFYKTSSLSASSHSLKITVTSSNASNNLTYSGALWVITNK